MLSRLRPIDRLFLLGIGLLGLIGLLTMVLFRQKLQNLRSPMVAYISAPLTSPEVWLTPTDGGQAFQLTSSGGRIYDFSVSPDGEYIAYSILSNSGGMEIYRIDRDGTKAVRLVDCGNQNCSQTTWSPDGKLIAYSQYGSVLEEKSQVKVISSSTGFEDPGVQNENNEGAYPSFSPDGKSLAYFSFSAEGYSIFNLETKDRFTIPSNSPDKATWAQDSSTIFYSMITENGLLPQSILMEYDLGLRQSQRFSEAVLAGFDASKLEWSPGGAWAAIGLRIPENQSGRQIYLMRSGGQDFQAITEEAGTSHTTYSWHPSSFQLVFQRYTPGTSAALPEVVLWNGDTDAMTTLVENAALPAWVP